MKELSFISNADFSAHIRSTVEGYKRRIQQMDLKKFNENIIDPVKLLFDKNVYKLKWTEIINHEIFRQRDKSNNNEIGYFHQHIFKYIKNCRVPHESEKTGWDIIYTNKDGIELPDGSKVSTAYVEMKNKHNTMNSSSAQKTFISMQNQILNDDDCVCLLVEVISKKSQNEKWAARVNYQKASHRCIRKVSIDQFYAMVTGVEDAFYQMCMHLPVILEDIISDYEVGLDTNDTVILELKEKSKEFDIDNPELAMILSIYALGFSSYLGF